MKYFIGTPVYDDRGYDGWVCIGMAYTPGWVSAEDWDLMASPPPDDIPIGEYLDNDFEG